MIITSEVSCRRNTTSRKWAKKSSGQQPTRPQGRIHHLRGEPPTQYHLGGGQRKSEIGNSKLQFAFSTSEVSKEAGVDIYLLAHLNLKIDRKSRLSKRLHSVSCHYNDYGVAAKHFAGAFIASY